MNFPQHIRDGAANAVLKGTATAIKATLGRNLLPWTLWNQNCFVHQPVYEVLQDTVLIKQSYYAVKDSITGDPGYSLSACVKNATTAINDDGTNPLVFPVPAGTILTENSFFVGGIGPMPLLANHGLLDAPMNAKFIIASVDGHRGWLKVLGPGPTPTVYAKERSMYKSHPPARKTNKNLWKIGQPESGGNQWMRGNVLNFTVEQWLSEQLRDNAQMTAFTADMGLCEAAVLHPYQVTAGTSSGLELLADSVQGTFLCNEDGVPSYTLDSTTYTFTYKNFTGGVYDCPEFPETDGVTKRYLYIPVSNTFVEVEPTWLGYNLRTVDVGGNKRYSVTEDEVKGQLLNLEEYFEISDQVFGDDATENDEWVKVHAARKNGDWVFYTDRFVPRSHVMRRRGKILLELKNDYRRNIVRPETVIAIKPTVNRVVTGFSVTAADRVELFDADLAFGLVSKADMPSGTSILFAPVTQKESGFTTDIAGDVAMFDGKFTYWAKAAEVANARVYGSSAKQPQSLDQEYGQLQLVLHEDQLHLVLQNTVPGGTPLFFDKDSVMRQLGCVEHTSKLPWWHKTNEITQILPFEQVKGMGRITGTDDYVGLGQGYCLMTEWPFAAVCTEYEMYLARAAQIISEPVLTNNPQAMKKLAQGSWDIFDFKDKLIKMGLSAAAIAAAVAWYNSQTSAAFVDFEASPRSGSRGCRAGRRARSSAKPIEATPRASGTPDG